MTREEVLELCRKAPDVGQVKHGDFVDYILVLESRRQVEGEWRTVENAYMTVDGKIAMANLDHRLQGKRLDFEDPVVLVDDEEQLTLMVTVVSEVYGRRHGIATSRKLDGTPTERDYAWEVAETSAIGRALSAMGYGVLPGAGLASAEDMLRATSPERAAPEERAVRERPRRPYARRVSRVSAYQRRQLVGLYRELHDMDEPAAKEAVETLFAETFGHTMDEGTYKEGSRLVAQLRAQHRAMRSKTKEGAQAASG
ncbi:MAG: hypothetical protein ACE5MB_01150 [Anaerolineae bacterium]